MFCTRHVSQKGLPSSAAKLAYSTTMTCPNNQAGNAFFVDSLINVRGDGYYPGSGLYLPPGSEYSYGLSTGSCFSGIAKRNEPGSQTSSPPFGPYVQGMEAWLETSRSGGAEPPRSHDRTNCSFARLSPTIKEENSYCVYESEKCPKGAAAEDASLPGIASGPCPGSNSTVPVPGYFRLSQTYTSPKLYHDDQPSCTFQRHPRFDASQAADRSDESAPAGTREREEAPCTPTRDDESRLSPESRSSPEPIETCTESTENTSKGERSDTTDCSLVLI